VHTPQTKKKETNNVLYDYKCTWTTENMANVGQFWIRGGGGEGGGEQ
jgi:hypothetical protein